MLHEVGSGVISLARLRVGGIGCEGMEPGEVREVSEEELLRELTYTYRR